MNERRRACPHIDSSVRGLALLCCGGGDLTVLFTDIEGSTALLRRVAEAAMHRCWPGIGMP